MSGEDGAGIGGDRVFILHARRREGCGRRETWGLIGRELPDATNCSLALKAAGGKLFSSIRASTAASFRDRLLARGQAQSFIRRDGVLPEGTPQFSTYLDNDLLNYGYALTSTGLQLLEPSDAPWDDSSSEDESTRRDVAHSGFLQASNALEAATRNAGHEDIAFHRLIARTASHLAGFTARAYSLMRVIPVSGPHPDGGNSGRPRAHVVLRFPATVVMVASHRRKGRRDCLWSPGFHEFGQANVVVNAGGKGVLHARQYTRNLMTCQRGDDAPPLGGLCGD